MATSDLSGQTIRSYEIQRRIGEGGFGEVYKAFQPLIKREVAIKVILPENASQPDFIRRFEAEAQLVARLEHPYIVPLYDFWRDPTGAYLVMRWLRGGSLTDRIRQGALDLRVVAKLLDQIAAALAAAHRAGVVHRDIKPDNILLDEEGNAYLTDFGIAKDITVDAEEGEGIVGTPSYLSPEQITGDKITPQSDVYALGVVLFEMITGTLPFTGTLASTVIMAHLNDPVPPITQLRDDLPPALNDVVQKATAKVPENRYSSPIALAAALRGAILGAPAGTTVDYDNLTPDDLARFGITERIPGVEPQNPYKGLRAFEEADMDDFFGREALVDRLIKRAASERFLAVIGPSGSGKSSVVMAGLLPLIRGGDRIANSDDWFIVEMTPGGQAVVKLTEALLRIAQKPMTGLEDQLRADARALMWTLEALLPAGTQLLLVIDQFEETFTQGEKPTDIEHFLSLLYHAASAENALLRVIVTLRADFYDRPLMYPQFGELLRQHTEVVLPMNADELGRAISEPAARSGLELEAGLQAAIVADVIAQPGALPLMQYALTELYERRDGRWLTRDAYDQIGGVVGALAQRADELYQQLGASDMSESPAQQAARQIFLRLVTPGEGAEDTRRRAHIAELQGLGMGDLADTVLNLYGKYRLLTFDNDSVTREPTVEIAHEALIRRWDRLRGWLSEAREGLLLQRRLSAASEEWARGGKDSSYLASGIRLDQFDALRQNAASGLSLTAQEQEYISVSVARRDQQRAAEAERAERERRTEQQAKQRLQLLVAVMTIAAIIAGGLAVFAVTQQQAAISSAATATIAQGQALNQAVTAVAAQNQAEQNAERAQENASTAVAAQDQAELNAQQARALALASGAQLALANENTDLALLLALEADNTAPNALTYRTLAAAAYSPGTRRLMTGHRAQVISVAYSPDGTRAVSASRDGTAIIWDVATGDVLHTLIGHENWLWDAAFSPDGSQVLTASRDGALILWDAETGEFIRDFTGHRGDVTGVAFHPDGTQALSSSHDGTLILWDLASGDAIRTFTGHTNEVRDLAFSSSGATALSASNDGSVILWNVETGEAINQYASNPDLGVVAHSGTVWSVAYTPDESGFITASDDRTAILWSFETGAPVRRFGDTGGGHSSRVTSASLSPDGTRLLTCGEDNTIIYWDSATGQVLRRFAGQALPVYGCTFNANATQFLSAGWDQTVRLWDLIDGAQLISYGGTAHPTGASAVAYSPDGRLLISGGFDGALILWDAQTGERLRAFERVGELAHNGRVWDVIFSPDGTQALSGAQDNTVVLWDVATGETLRTFNNHTAPVMTVAFSPDGTQALSGAQDNTLILWDLASGDLLNRYLAHTNWISDVVFLTDGERALSASFDTTAILWDLTTAEPQRVYRGHLDWVRGVALSPDAATFLTGSADATLMLWDLESGDRLRVLQGHNTLIRSVAYSPDGRFLYSGSADTSVIIWDAATGEELSRYSASSGVNAIALRPDDGAVAAAYQDGTVRAWITAVDRDALREWATTNRALRSLSCPERDRYAIEPFCPPPTQPGRGGSVGT